MKLAARREDALTRISHQRFALVLGVRWTLGVAAVGWLIALAAQGSADSIEVEPGNDPGSIRLGVTTFKTSAPPGSALPDIGTLLADRIGTRGVERIVGPDEMGAPAVAEPGAGDIKAWAANAKVDGVVVGRTTRIGSQLSVDVRLLSARTGKVAGSYIAEVRRPEQLASAIDTLASQLIDGAVALVERPAQEKGQPVGLDSTSRVDLLDSQVPISIKSDSLEVNGLEGDRQLVFTGHVQVVQEDIKMTSQRLVADYPDGSSQPDRLIASGGVLVIQGSQEARCDESIYQRVKNTLMCCGDAELRDRANFVRGTCIEFDLERETVRVENAEVSIDPGQEEAQSGETAWGDL